MSRNRDDIFFAVEGPEHVRLALNDAYKKREVANFGNLPLFVISISPSVPENAADEVPQLTKRGF